MTNLRFSPYVLSIGLFAALSMLSFPAVAEEGEESMSILPAAPEWVEGLEATGRYVHVEGSESKFREDFNIQSGAVLGAGAHTDEGDGKIFRFDGSFQPVDQQGYLRMGYDEIGVFSFDAEFQGWSEFYNTTPGVDDTTVLGNRIGGAVIPFPSNTNSRALFGGGKPSVDWLTFKSGISVELPGPFNDVYANFIYRDVGGEMSLAKGGTLLDPTAVPPVVLGSGPGTVFFDYPGRKEVDYETVGGLVGVRSSLGGIAWRFDASAHRHDIDANTREANFFGNATLSEIENFREETEVVTASANLVGSRQVTPELFVYGGGVFGWAESEPEPSQIVQSGFLPAATTSTLTRDTFDSEVEKFSEAVNAGFVYQPAPSVVASVDLGLRASQQDGDLTELRNESTFLTGDTGIVANDADRDHLSMFAKGNVTWKAARRFTLKGHASYKYFEDSVDTSRVFAFVVAEPAEIEKYDIQRERVKVGASGRYRFRAGRKLEIGYDFQYEGADTDIDELTNQFVVADYTRLQHTIHAKFSGRITRKLRAEIRGEYRFEERDMDAPLVNAVVLGTADNGEVEFQGITISPTLMYQHSATLSGFMNVTLGRQHWELSDSGAAPPGSGSLFSSFEYETVTETGTIGVNWSPTERLKGTASYTIYANQESVENFGHNALIRGSFELDEDWDLNGGIRYIGYDPDDNTIDNYNTVIVTLGFVGRF